MTDFLIVGQGIAGVCVAHEALKRGYSIKCVDHPTRQPVSSIAAGVINPVTGRRLVRTWNAEEVIECAASFYRDAAEVIGYNACAGKRILLCLDDGLKHENWLLRTADEVYSRYLDKVIKLTDNQLLAGDLFGVISGAYQVDLQGFVRASVANFEERKILDSKVYSKYSMNTISGDIAAGAFRHIVFCEGRSGHTNTLFSWLPHTFAKGEALFCKIPGLNTNDIIKGAVVIAPMGKDLYWVGSTYNWEDDNDDPTPDVRARLEQGLRRTINCNYEISRHVAGVRPAAKDRRPFVGTHPESDNVHILNGLGSKGASLAPYCAGRLLDSIIHGKSLPDEINILRYFRS